MSAEGGGTPERPEDIARVPADLEDLIPGYLERLRNDLGKARESLKASDLPSVQTFGHKSAGSGGSYGFPEVTRLGREIERLAKAKQLPELAVCLDSLEAHLRRVRVVFVED